MPTMDVSELGRKNDKKRAIVLIVTVTFVTAIVLIAVFTKHIWLPVIRGEEETAPAAAEVLEETTSESDEFHIDIDSGMGYQLMSMENALALLDDSSFHIYNLEGKVLNETQHSYANPILCTSKTKALIYDVGGTQFRLEGKSKQVYDKNTDGVIYLARLSDADYAAVVTKSDKYLSELRVYNEKGNVFFSYYSYDSRIIDIEFNKNSTGCIITVLSAEKGQLISRMMYYDFNGKSPEWTSPGIATLAMDVRWFDNDTIAMVGDTAYALFDSNGHLLDKYTYDTPIKDYASSGSAVAVITENSNLRRTMLTIFAPGASPVVRVLDGGEKDVFISGSDIYLLAGDYIDIFSTAGEKTGLVNKLSDRFEKLCKNGKYIYLLGYDSVGRIDYVK
ncbi:MAG: hypothetical protein ILP19_08565 [Oscillospiraceae bacterium]|nr:hypothetical protein [Oscillospiraceae bacterium]